MVKFLRRQYYDKVPKLTQEKIVHACVCVYVHMKMNLEFRLSGKENSSSSLFHW